MELCERKEILEKSGLCLFCLKHTAELECYGRRGLSKPRCMQAGCDGEHTPHYGTNRSIKREVRTELRIAQLFLVGFLRKKVNLKAYVVTDLRSYSVVTLSSSIYQKQLGNKIIFM
jgi:hypothetical protein